MTRTTMSRRNALTVIGRAGATLGAGICFFLSLRTKPLIALDRPRKDTRVGSPVPPEKVVVSGTGRALTVRISGPPGRHFAVTCAKANTREIYKAVPGARGTVGKDGTGIVEIRAKNLPDGRIFLRICTGRTGSLDEDIAGTEAFVVKVSKGAIIGYEGVLSRPLISAGVDQTCATAAAVCAAVKRR